MSRSSKRERAAGSAQGGALEKVLEHGHGERFAEAARTAEKRGLRAVEHVAHQKRLVHEHAVCDYLRKRANKDPGLLTARRIYQARARHDRHAARVGLEDAPLPEPATLSLRACRFSVPHVFYRECTIPGTCGAACRSTRTGSRLEH
jgi:hypothetical protein